MRGRRQKAFALVVLAAGLSLLGLGAGGDAPEPLLVFCGPEHIRELFEWGSTACQGFGEEYEDACAASSVLTMCPAAVSCGEGDPFWCAPCADRHGAPFWKSLGNAIEDCNRETFGKHYTVSDMDYSHMDKEAYAACFQANVVQNCPALAETDWFEWHQSFARRSKQKSFMFPTL